MSQERTEALEPLTIVATTGAIMGLKKLVCVVGTRPEAIKMAPVIQQLRSANWCEVEVLATGQHRQMLDQVLNLFGIRADHDLNLMRDNQSLSDLTARALTGIDAILQSRQPFAVLAQGDTTTVLATAMACFYRGVRFCHVEAGLRTYDLSQPFPEEFNRVVASVVSSVHFAPTSSSRDNLLREGIDPKKIVVTGNTVIDALHWMAAQKPTLPISLPDSAKVLLMTVHRRENFGAPLDNICRAALQVVDQNRDLHLVLPVHANPNVKGKVEQILSNHPRIHLVPPLEYDQFVAAMQRSHFILTDSGGVQEEAPALGKPVLVMRRTTERPEAVETGVARLVGTERDELTAECQRLIDDPDWYRRMAVGASPYGDGLAAPRIVRAMEALV